MNHYEPNVKFRALASVFVPRNVDIGNHVVVVIEPVEEKALISDHPPVFGLEVVATDDKRGAAVVLHGRKGRYHDLVLELRNVEASNLLGFD